MSPVIDVSDEVLQRITDSIVKTSNPERIILFGSRATTVYQSDSDVDLLVVLESEFDCQGSRIEEIARMEKALRGTRIPTDLLVYSHDEFERWKDTPTHVIHRAVQQGKVLYERSST